VSDLLVERDGPLLRVTFNRPAQRNALTWEMYEGLAAACDQADADEGIRAMLLRGAGDAAFVSGTDIAQFQDFADGEDGVAYEAKLAALAGRLEAVTVPTVAAVSGYCVGAGLALAASCDIRVATDDARFGIPVARTLGNCLSMPIYALLVSHLGPARTLDMFLRARFFTAAEAAVAGFVAETCAPGELDAIAGSVLDRVLEHAPLTMWATKEAVRRLRLANLPDGDDIVRAVYGSADFHRGVAAFLAKERPDWTGN
jgi:enoyl-CoA hydratase/carnithine racemase